VVSFNSFSSSPLAAAGLYFVLSAVAHAKCITETSAGKHRGVPCYDNVYPTPVGNQTYRLKVDYNVPALCVDSSQTKCGLIFDVHGTTMSSQTEDKNTNMIALGEQHGYIVVQPHAPGNDWDGTCSYPPPDGNWDHCVDDKAVLHWLDEALSLPQWKIDRNRLHFMGFSSGAIMTWRMICHQPNLFASFVPIEGVVPDGPPNGKHFGVGCLQKGAAQPAVLAQQGRKDAMVTWRNWLQSEAYLKEVWKLGEATTIAGPGEEWNRTRYARADGGVPFEILFHSYIAEGAISGTLLRGHCFPGSDDINGLIPFGCPGKKERAKGHFAGYNIGEEAMKWFLAHPREDSPMLV